MEQDSYADQAEQFYQRLIAPIECRMIGLVGRLIQNPDEAADAFQDVLASVWKRLRYIDRHPNPHAYVLRMCVNRAYTQLRKQSRRCEVPLDTDPQNPASDDTDRLVQAEEMKMIRAAIGRLPSKQGKVVLLRAMQDYSYEEISVIMSCSPVTVRSHYSKGLATLRKSIGERARDRLAGSTK